jgi:8-oxo-dGTP pyrophosphatase MutT (NUDIX family)/phosphohistidine phosphatase SixA
MPSNKPGSRMIKAAGGVAWRPGPDGKPEILLVHRKKYDDWSLPKGKTEPGETLPVTAVREVLEEGGAQLALGRRLASVRYSVGGRPKRVHYWVARVLSVDARAVPNSEVDEVAWLPADRAVDKVSYTHDHGVLADFAARPVGTVPLILLRHAKALDKHGWKRSDAVRPLADSGRADAKALADLLACFAPRPRLFSSTAVRCLDTLRPLSRLIGAPVRQVPSLYIHNKPSGTEAADPAAELAALVREVIAAGEPAVLCAHRENIPALREAALAALAGHPGHPGGPDGDPGDAQHDGAGAGLNGLNGLNGRHGLSELPKDWEDPLPTAGFWVLNIAPLPVAAEPGAGEPVPAEPAAAAAAGDPRATGPAGRGPESAPAAAPPVPARRWWRRLRGAGRGRGRANATAREAAAAGPSATRAGTRRVSADQARADDRHADQRRVQWARADGPVGVLVSADRYDLSES